ncbi:MAG: PorV/PorQ family protein [candidate division FCPU426 bacterium]
MKSFVLLGLLLGAVGLRADQGSTAASFLKLQTGPRAIAMAESFSGLADDINAIQYNPGGLGFLSGQQFTIMHATWFEDMSYEYAAIASNFKSFGTIALSGLYLNGGSFDKYVLDSSGSPVSQGTFGASSIAMGFSYARTIIPSLSMGMNVKLISETIDTESTSGFSADFGTFYRMPFKGWTTGFELQNMGTNFGFEQAFELPLTLRVGVGYKPSANVAVDMDYVQPKETVGHISVGGEYAYRMLFLRLGYKYGGALDYDQTFTGFGPAIAAGLTMGLGFKYSNFQVDYAYANYGFLGTPHRVALTVKF